MNQSPGPQSAWPENYSIRDVLDEHARTNPHAPFLVDPYAEQITTFAEAHKSARAIAGFLKSRGISKSDRVAYAMSNSTTTALHLLGIFYSGAQAVAINLVNGTDAIAYVLEHSEAKLVFLEPDHRALIDAAVSATRSHIVVMETAGTVMQNPGTGIDNFGTVAALDDALLMYTSGTTGRPKGVMLTHASLLADGTNTMCAHALTHADRVLCVLPLYHINGLCVTLMAPLVSGGSVVMPRKFSVSDFWQQIRRFKCTWFSIVPTQVSYLLHDKNNDLEPGSGYPGVRFARSASAPLSPEVQKAFESRFGVPVIETMGLTETAAQILSNPLPPGIRKIGSPGVAIGNEVIIANEDQKQVPPGVEGELLVRGANIMRGYLKNEKATRDAITSDGWLRTGDLGKMDEDGYIYITGRLKELIIKGGENIAPREIDDALYSHPDVVEAAAFGCTCPNYGQRVEAAVMVSENSALSEQDLLELCAKRIGTFKSPDKVHFLTELPKGPSRKIQRIKLTEKFG